MLGCTEGYGRGKGDCGRFGGRGEAWRWSPRIGTTVRKSGPVSAPGAYWCHWLSFRSLGLQLKHDSPWKAVVGRVRLPAQTATRVLGLSNHESLALFDGHPCGQTPLRRPRGALPRESSAPIRTNSRDTVARPTLHEWRRQEGSSSHLAPWRRTRVTDSLSAAAVSSTGPRRWAGRTRHLD